MSELDIEVMTEAMVTEVWDDWVTQYTTAPYTVTTEYGEGLEERLYPAMTWVCDHKTVDKETDDQRSGLFWPLFRYIQGSNSASLAIPMTTPVTTLVTSTSGGTSMTMCFFLGDSSKTWPQPTDAAVFLQTEEQRSVLTRTIGGYMTTASWNTEAAALSSLLAEKGLSVVAGRHYQVGYDAPYKFWNRKNEIWYEKA